MELLRRRAMMSMGGFPKEPSFYELIGTCTSSQTWTVPEDGYFQIEVFGASGSGGAGKCSTSVFASLGKLVAEWATGGGGGGGGYACSRVMMKKGDTVAIVCGTVGAVSSATINSSLAGYSKMDVTSGANGRDATSTGSSGAGYGGNGGTASGGNYANNSGGTGGMGTTGAGATAGSGGSGGAAGYTGGNAGGTGGAGANNSAVGSYVYYGNAGKAGFIKIYRGNTN